MSRKNNNSDNFSSNNNSGDDTPKPDVKLIEVDPTKVRMLNEGVDPKVETRKANTEEK